MTVPLCLSVELLPSCKGRLCIWFRASSFRWLTIYIYLVGSFLFGGRVLHTAGCSLIGDNLKKRTDSGNVTRRMLGPGGERVLRRQGGRHGSSANAPVLVTMLSRPDKFLLVRTRIVFAGSRRPDRGMGTGSLRASQLPDCGGGEEVGGALAHGEGGGGHS